MRSNEWLKDRIMPLSRIKVLSTQNKVPMRFVVVAMLPILQPSVRDKEIYSIEQVDKTIAN